MTRDRSPSRRTVHPDPNAGPDPAAPLPSPRTAAVLAALPVLTVAVASFPLAAAFVLAILVGGVAGAALQRRYPTAVDRTLSIVDGDPVAAGDR
jgi:hypothetical protein